MYTTLVLAKPEPAIATVTLNRPDSLNALDFSMKNELIAAFKRLNVDDTVKVIIIQAQGKAFCAGGDILSMGSYAPGGGRLRMLKSQPLYSQIINSDKITIAAVQGYAAGAGLSLACCCNFRIAADNARFLASFINLSLVPDGGLMYTLPRLLGSAKALELFLLAEPAPAEQALALGLVNKVVPAAELPAAALDFARSFTGKTALTVALIKNIVNKSLTSDLSSILDAEAVAQDICMQTPEHKQAVAAFLNKKSKAAANSHL